MKTLERQLGEFNLAVDDRFKAVDTRIATTEVRVTKLEELIAQKPQQLAAIEVMEKIKVMEKTLADWTIVGAPSSADNDRDRERIAVLGGLRSLASKEDAATWIKDKLWQLYGPQPTEVYCKGEFRGIIFANFSHNGDRDEAVRLLRKAGCTEGGNTVWAKQDQNLQTRILTTFVFATKRFMGYDGRSVWADVETGSVWLGEDMVATASIQGKTLAIEYGEGWESFLNDAEFPDFKDMVRKLQDKLASAGDPAKGKGIGKNKSSKGKGKPKGTPSY